MQYKIRVYANAYGFVFINLTVHYITFFVGLQIKIILLKKEVKELLAVRGVERLKCEL